MTESRHSAELIDYVIKLNLFTEHFVKSRLSMTFLSSMFQVHYHYR